MTTEASTPERKRFLLFCVVGASGMIADFGSFHLLRWCGLTGGLGLGAFAPSYANMLSVAIAIQWNFAGNRWITFSDRDTDVTTAWWRFNVFSSFTWVLNQLIVGGLRAAYPPATVDWLGVGFSNENLWKLIAIGICTGANFWLSSRLAFQDRSASGGPPA